MRNADVLCISAEASLRQTLSVIDDGGMGIALVVDDMRRLVGVITDGDARRSLLHLGDLDIQVSMVMSSHFRTLGVHWRRSDARRVMLSESLHQMPVVDTLGRVVGIVLLEDVVSRDIYENPVVIMAGGRGSRLLPLTESTPKPLLRVGKESILESIIRKAAEEGFQNFIVAIHYLGDQIVDALGDGSRLGVKINYVREESPLGTAGALGLIDPWGSGPCIVLNADLLTDVKLASMLEFHSRHESDLTICVRAHHTDIPFGVVSTDGQRVVSIEEKPRVTVQISAGIYAIERRVLDSIPTGAAMDMTSLIGSVVQKGGIVLAYPTDEYWLDVGDLSSLDRARSEGS